MATPPRAPRFGPTSFGEAAAGGPAPTEGAISAMVALGREEEEEEEDSDEEEEEEEEEDAPLPPRYVRYLRDAPHFDTEKVARVSGVKGQPLGVVWSTDGGGNMHSLEVADPSPAAAAGIVPGWRLMDIDGVRVRGEEDLKHEISRLKTQGGGCLRMVPSFTLAEVNLHNTEESCWIVVGDRVYDVTEFLPKHPGGKGKVMKYAGQAVTAVFNRIHSKVTKEHVLPRYFIGYYRMGNAVDGGA